MFLSIPWVFLHWLVQHGRESGVTYLLHQGKADTVWGSLVSIHAPERKLYLRGPNTNPSQGSRFLVSHSKSPSLRDRYRYFNFNVKVSEI